MGRAKAAEDLRALLMLPSRLALFQELSGLCRRGDLHRVAGTHQKLLSLLNVVVRVKAQVFAASISVPGNTDKPQYKLMSD